MPSRKVKAKAKKASRSRRLKNPSEWSLKNTWTWLTGPPEPHHHAQEKSSRRRRPAKGSRSRTKRSTAYHANCQDDWSHRRKASARYGSRRSHHKKSDEYPSTSRKDDKKKKKAKMAAVCVCALGCQKDHKHTKTCHAEVMCVCASGPSKKKKEKKEKKVAGSRKTAVAYREIVREGYVRKDGVVVPPTLIEDRGLPGKGPKLIPKLRKGTLRRHGYSTKDSQHERHEALRKAVAAEGPTVVIRKLNVVATLNKNTNPEMSKHLKKDSDWVKSQFGTTAHPK